MKGGTAVALFLLVLSASGFAAQGTPRVEPAHIVIYWSKALEGRYAKLPIEIDGQTVLRMTNGRYFRMSIVPGRHVMQIYENHSWLAPSHVSTAHRVALGGAVSAPLLPFVLGPGDAIYVSVSLRLGRGLLHNDMQALLTQELPANAESAILKLKPLDRRWIDRSALSSLHAVPVLPQGQ
jgi:hypothetical protein